MSQLSDPFLSDLAAIIGRENVISRPEDLLVYESDAYTLEKNLPNVVVLPNSTEVAAGAKWKPVADPLRLSGLLSAVPMR